MLGSTSGWARPHAFGAAFDRPQASVLNITKAPIGL
jgi:hypothetical protein